MRVNRPILCLVGVIVLLVSAGFFQTSYELLMKYMGVGSSYWNDIKDAQIVLRIAVSSLGIVFGVWAILIGLIPDKN